MDAKSIKELQDNGFVVPKRIVDNPESYSLLSVVVQGKRFITISNSDGLVEVEYIL